MIITSTDHIAGYEITETLDIARGSTVRARNLGRDIFAGLKNLVGGEIREYTQLMAAAREQAIERMEADAEDLGADAIINVRFMTAMVMQGASEILAYGTAVKIRKIA
ncbi:MAG TPA: YbjQ family protein [Saprospiraceae bacterium]|nr:YbjQ family protein [Saprospiraceae bacterium]